MSPRKQKTQGHGKTSPKSKTVSLPDSPAKALPQKSKKTVWLPYLILTLLTLIAYSLSFDTEFIYNWDDAGYIINSTFTKSLSVENLRAIFSEINYMSNYHPLTTLSYAFDWQIAGENPAWYHAINLLFHLANTLLVFIVIKRFFKTENDWVPFFVAMIFAVHPMHVESVAWISERKDVMYTFFFLLGLLKYNDFIEATSQSWKQYLLCLLFFVLSLMSKSAAVVFPVVLFVFDWYRRRRFSLMLVVEKIPLLALSVLFGVIALKSQADAMQNLAPLLTITERMQIVNHSFLTYIYKFFLPINLSAYYPYPLKDNSVLPAIYSFAPFITLILVGVVIGLIMKKKKVPYTREILFGIAFFVINLGLVLQLKPVGGAVLAERYTYIPYIGLALPVAFILGKNAHKETIRQWLIGLIAVLFCVLSFMRVPVWNNGERLFSNVIDQFPRNPYAYDNRGGLYWDIYASKIYKDNPVKKQHYTQKAYDDYTMALSLDSRFVQAWVHRAILLFNTDSLQGSLRDFNKALELDSLILDGLKGRASTLSKLQRFKESASDYTKYLSFKPDDEDAIRWRAIAYCNMAEFKKANDDLNQAIRLKPDDAEAWYWKGLVHYYEGKKELDDQALAFAQASHTTPDKFVPGKELLQRIQQKNDSTLFYLAKSLKIKPEYEEVLVWQGFLFSAGKKFDQAIESYTKVLSINPKNATALINRSIAFYELNDYSRALTDLESARALQYPVNQDFYMAVMNKDPRFKSK